jgi:hypothetical protein
MRSIHLAPLASAILLAACGGSADTNDDGAISEEEVVAEAAGMVRPQPGEYRTTYELLEFDMPGLPEAVRAQMHAQMGGAAGMVQPMTYCLTPEEAEANGAEQMAKRMAEGDCTVARFDASGGSVSAEMQCSGADGTTTHVTMDGQMTATSSAMTMAAEVDRQGQKVTTKSRVTTQRIGDCPA